MLVEEKMDMQFIPVGGYVSPRIIRTIPVVPEGSILTASIHERMTVETTGHEVKNYDWSPSPFDPSQSPFNHTWE